MLLFAAMFIMSGAAPPPSRKLSALAVPLSFVDAKLKDPV